MNPSNIQSNFLRYCALEENLSPSTVRSIKWAFNTFRARTGIENPSKATTDELRNFFYEGKEKYQWSASTTLNYMKYLKKFFNWCVKEGHIGKNPILEIKKPKLPKTLPRVLTREQANAILCTTFTRDWLYTFEKYRNYAIIAVFLYTGVRARELLNLRTTDVNLNSERIFISEGKGRKDRYIPIHRKLKNILDSYTRERKRLNKTSEYFFTGVKSNSPLTYKDLSRLCGKISKAAGIKFTPHALRHTAATEFLNQGLDIYKVSKMLGHSDIKTTTIYLHVATEKLQQDVNALDLY